MSADFTTSPKQSVAPSVAPSDQNMSLTGDEAKDGQSAKILNGGINASYETKPSNRQNTPSTIASGRATAPSSLKSMDDEEKTSLTAPARKPAKMPLSPSKETPMYSSELESSSRYRKRGISKAKRDSDTAPPKAHSKYDEKSTDDSVAALPKGYAEYSETSAAASKEMDAKMASAIGSSHDKSRILDDVEKNSHEVRPGAVHVRGTSYRSDQSSPSFNEAHNNESTQPVVEERFSPPETLANESIVSAYAVHDDEPGLVHEAKVINVKRQRVLLILGVFVVIIIVVAVTVPVVMKVGNSDDNIPVMTFSAIINDLCSPRHMKVHDDMLFVPEAGVGPMEIGNSLCLPTTDATILEPICFGNTGQVSVYELDGTSTGIAPLIGLFSARSTEGVITNQVYGASAVDFDDSGNMFTLLGCGLVNASEVAINDPELVFASVLRDDQVVASPWVKVFEKNYAGAPVPETNPFHLHIHDGTTYIADAGADLLYTYLNVVGAGTDEPDSVIVLPKIENIPAVKPNPRGGPCKGEVPPLGPSYCGQYQDDEGNWLYTANPVPTAVRVNPNEPNRLYVAYLSGSYWNEPVSGIFYMDLVGGLPQNSTIKSIRGDLWAVIDFGFYEDSIFVLETNPGGFVPFDGRLSQVNLDSNGSIASRVTITENLYEPVSMLIHDDMIYISNTTFNGGFDDCNGHILSAKLR